MLIFPNFEKKVSIKNIAVLTSGGDAPGMNAAIRAVVRKSLEQEIKVVGIYKGYRGLLEGHFKVLDHSFVGNAIQRGGTLLKTDRCEAFFLKEVRQRAHDLLRKMGLEALIVIGGDGSFTGAHLLQQETGFPVIGIPGTIDNDIAGTDESIGFDTAVHTAVEAIDRIRDTANSHNRIFLVEVMGHNSGFLALQVALAGGAESVVLPGKNSYLIEKIVATIKKGVDRGKTSSIMVVAEGPRPGLCAQIAHQLSQKGFTSRTCVLGHIQRGGSPTPRDRVLASVLGAASVQAILAGESGCMMGVQKSQVVCVPLNKVIGVRKFESQKLSELITELS